jgi:hypothetical protein
VPQCGSRRWQENATKRSSPSLRRLLLPNRTIFSIRHIQFVCDANFWVLSAKYASKCLPDKGLRDNIVFFPTCRRDREMYFMSPELKLLLQWWGEADMLSPPSPTNFGSGNRDRGSLILACDPFVFKDAIMSYTFPLSTPIFVPR